MNDFKIIKFRSYTKGTLQGFFTVGLPSGMVIHDFSLHVNGRSRWVGPPSKRYAKKDGTEAFEPLVQFSSRQAADRFRDLALAALDKAGYGNEERKEEPTRKEEPLGPPRAEFPDFDFPI